MLGKYVRRWKTYVGRIRTSTNHVHQYNIAESCSSPEYVQEENAYVTENTYVGGTRTSAEYVRTNQHLRFVLTVVDLPECVPRISITMVVVGTRCRRSEDKRI